MHLAAAEAVLEESIAEPERLPAAMGEAARMLDQLPGARVLVTLEDLNPSQLDVSGDLHDLFSLSDAEAQIAMALHDGHDIATLARLCGVRPATIRKQVLSLFEKLNVRRQTDVVQLVSKLRQ